MNLLDYACTVHSQCGEDGIIAKLFEVLGLSAAREPWAVEFGAGDGVTLSNTAALIDGPPIRSVAQGWLDWHAVLIEADPAKADACRQRYADRREWVQVIERAIGWQDRDGLDAILAETRCPREFDLLSVDIDGNDWHCWAAVRNYRPRVVLIEFNPTFPPFVSWVQQPDQTINRGCSLLALVQLGMVKGYELAACTDWNAFFVNAAEFPALGIADNRPEALWTHREYIRWVASGYDGTMIAGGCPVLMWHGMALDMDQWASRIQVLPPERRVYGGRLQSAPEIQPTPELDVDTGVACEPASRLAALREVVNEETTERERGILADHIASVPLRVTADRLSLSVERVRQIRDNALAKLRNAIEVPDGGRGAGKGETMPMAPTRE